MTYILIGTETMCKGANFSNQPIPFQPGQLITSELTNGLEVIILKE